MTKYTAIYKGTQELHAHLSKPMPTDDTRDTYIETVTDMLAAREELLVGVEPPSNDDEEVVAKEIVEMNKVIQMKLKIFQGIIQQDINKLKHRKKSGQKYENPYDGPTTDGIFFDSKK
ncbi:hypothetical protein FLK61_37370 [Paenalkalicoccus suaedae]|uniref:Flagellar protein FliT n=1 Tax=Paenalkalicoccus suaedae TaxID=2592382 RepID=A0A859FGS0_9BACI|nr:hypothetical protein [Paenalkalicoccus suaedae]QKS72307.1 hypothetical protein FLK61_37370 [Paenalkalicoccus suaedae]